MNADTRESNAQDAALTYWKERAIAAEEALRQVRELAAEYGFKMIVRICDEALKTS